MNTTQHSTVNIPLVGNSGALDKILCSKCNFDALSIFPRGFTPSNQCFHKDYVCFSYIACGGLMCGYTWLHCFVCDKTFSKKQGYDRHVLSLKHKENTSQIKTALDRGLIRTRRGTGSKIQIEPKHEDGNGKGITFNPAAKQELNAISPRNDPSCAGKSDAPGLPNTSNAVKTGMQSTSSSGVSLHEMITLFGDQNNNATFFYQESCDPGSGGTRLLRRAFGLGDKAIISDDEQRFVFELTTLLLNLTVEDRSRLGYILGCVVDRTDAESGIFHSIRVPRSVRDFDSILLKGKNSIVKNLPCPDIRTTPDGTHAFVGLIDVIAHVLATDTPIEALHPVQHEDGQATGKEYVYEQFLDFKTEVYTPVSSTPAAKILSMELHHESDGVQVLYLFMKEWSDDFDPSHTKSNRAQAWLKTFTISPPTNKDAKTPRNTCITILGSKGDDHDPVEEFFTEELHTLSSGGGRNFFHGGLNRVIRVKAGVLTTCVDRPERTKLFGVGDHNGTYSTCWGYATEVDVSRKSNCLPSCTMCRRRQLHLYTNISPAVSTKRVSSFSTNKRSRSIIEQVDSFQPFNVGMTNEEQTLELGDETDDDSVYSENEPRNDDNEESDDDKVSTEEEEICVNRNGGKPKGITCPEQNCAAWDLLDPHMSFKIPEKFPKKGDVSYSGNIPNGRDVVEIMRTQQTWLVTINMTIQWLEDVARYAYHHVGTCVNSGGKRKLYYWNKEQYYTFCRTCGFTKALSSAIEQASKGGTPCPIPTRWKRERALEKCHFAAMHMLFLGHVKSNMELFSKWLSVHELLAKFGRQVNTILINVRDLRLPRFHALPLSTSSWGTGPWVSENYVFWQRAWKYFFGHPVLNDCPKLHKPSILPQYNVAKRFIATSHACISSIMTPTSDGSERMRRLIPLYLDTMVEMDEMTRNAATKKKSKNGEEVRIIGDPQTGKKKGVKKNNPTYVKSNSLGLLAVADAHDYFGSAAMNWEGGDEGERKIQSVKPYMSIRRKNAQWQKLCMQKIYTNDTISWLLDRLPSTSGQSISSLHQSKFHVYKEQKEALDAMKGNFPLSIYEIDGHLYLLYKPIGDDEYSRSSAAFMPVGMDDSTGIYRFGCWYAKIEHTTTPGATPGIVHTSSLASMVDKNILALPLIRTNTSRADEYDRTSMYYLISDDWDERITGGCFIKSHVTESLFSSW